MDTTSETIAGLLQCTRDTEGYPLPSSVVKYYRKQATYTDRNGKIKHWTQADLAQRLGLSVVMVKYMETRGWGLESIERRRALAKILKIPPALLGLASLDQIVELVTGPAPPIQQAEMSVTGDKLATYLNTYNTYKKMYRDGLSYMIIPEIERVTKQLEKDATAGYTTMKEQMLYILWQYEILCAKIYSADLLSWIKTFEHIDNAKDISVFLDDRDLQAASLCHAAIFHFRRGRIGLAKMDIDSALLYAKAALPQTKGIIYSKSACIYTGDTSMSGSTLVHHMLEEAEKFTEIQGDKHTISFGQDVFLVDKAYVYNTLHRPVKSLECLDVAEKYVQDIGKRHLVFLDIKRAQCYIEQKKPEYEQAIFILINAIEMSKELYVARNIEHVQRLYHKLAASSYGNSPDVADLGMMLRELQRK